MLKKITDNVEIHQTLPDTPNLTTQELKKEWDKGPKILKEAFNNLIDELNNNMFPIGYRMFINNDKDYSNHLGFTWSKVAKGRVLIGKDENDTDFNTVGKVGGKKTHTLNTDEIPSHNHSIAVAGTRLDTNGDGYFRAQTHNSISEGDFWDIGLAKTGNGTHDANITNTGENQPHNNLQPYEVVNIWERIL